MEISSFVINLQTYSVGINTDSLTISTYALCFNEYTVVPAEYLEGSSNSVMISCSAMSGFKYVWTVELSVNL